MSDRPDCRYQSEQLRSAIMAGRSGAPAASDVTPTSKIMVPGMVQCEHCMRSFSKEAGERHIAKCKDIKAKPAALKRGDGRRLGSSKS